VSSEDDFYKVTLCVNNELEELEEGKPGKGRCGFLKAIELLNKSPWNK
jgi:hypothetical protein